MKFTCMIFNSCTLLLAVTGLCSATTDASFANPWPHLEPTMDTAVDLPNVTASGYLPLSDSKTEDMLFYAYYEAQETNGKDTPILLWLEVHIQAHVPRTRFVTCNSRNQAECCNYVHACDRGVRDARPCMAISTYWGHGG